MIKMKNIEENNGLLSIELNKMKSNVENEEESKILLELFQMNEHLFRNERILFEYQKRIKRNVSYELCIKILNIESNKNSMKVLKKQMLNYIYTVFYSQEFIIPLNFAITILKGDEEKFKDYFNNPYVKDMRNLCNGNLNSKNLFDSNKRGNYFVENFIIYRKILERDMFIYGNEDLEFYMNICLEMAEIYEELSDNEQEEIVKKNIMNIISKWLDRIKLLAAKEIALWFVKNNNKFSEDNVSNFFLEKQDKNYNLEEFMKYFEKPLYATVEKKFSPVNLFSHKLINDNIFEDLDNFFNKSMKKFKKLNFEEKILQSNYLEDLLNLKNIGYENKDIFQKINKIILINYQTIKEVKNLHLKMHSIKKKKFKIFKIFNGGEDNQENLQQQQQNQDQKNLQLENKLKNIINNEQSLSSNLKKLEILLISVLKFLCSDEKLTNFIDNLQYSLTNEVINLVIEKDSFGVNTSFLTYKNSMKNSKKFQDLFRELGHYQSIYSLFIEFADVYSRLNLNCHFLTDFFEANNVKSEIPSLIYRIRAILTSILLNFLEENHKNCEMFKGLVEKDDNSLEIIRKALLLKKEHHLVLFLYTIYAKVFQGLNRFVLPSQKISLFRYLDSISKQIYLTKDIYSSTFIAASSEFYCRSCQFMNIFIVRTCVWIFNYKTLIPDDEKKEIQTFSHIQELIRLLFNELINKFILKKINIKYFL